jgi:hypothetical protein
MDLTKLLQRPFFVYTPKNVLSSKPIWHFTKFLRLEEHEMRDFLKRKHTVSVWHSVSCVSCIILVKKDLLEKEL